jgi:hypothetical protein
LLHCRYTVAILLLHYCNTQALAALLMLGGQERDFGRGELRLCFLGVREEREVLHTHAHTHTYTHIRTHTHTHTHKHTHTHTHTHTHML